MPECVRGGHVARGCVQHGDCTRRKRRTRAKLGLIIMRGSVTTPSTRCWTSRRSQAADRQENPTSATWARPQVSFGLHSSKPSARASANGDSAVTRPTSRRDERALEELQPHSGADAPIAARVRPADAVGVVRERVRRRQGEEASGAPRRFYIDPEVTAQGALDRGADRPPSGSAGRSECAAFAPRSRRAAASALPPPSATNGARSMFNNLQQPAPLSFQCCA